VMFVESFSHAFNCSSKTRAAAFTDSCTPVPR
jgi:hypothetical protein